MSLLLEGAYNAYIVQAYARTDYLAGASTRGWMRCFRRVRSFLLVTSCISPVSVVLFSLVMMGWRLRNTQLRMAPSRCSSWSHIFLRAGPDLVGQSGRYLVAAAPGEFDVRQHQALLVCATGQIRRRSHQPRCASSIRRAPWLHRPKRHVLLPGQTIASAHQCFFYH